MNPLHPSLLDELRPFIKDYGPLVVALITAFVAAGITWIVQARQLQVAKEVKDIAHSQFINAQTKLRLEMFEHRFKAMQDVKNSIKHIINPTKTYRGSYDVDDFMNAIEPIRYLFNDLVYEYLIEDVIPVIDEYNSAHARLASTDISDMFYSEIQEEANNNYFVLLDEIRHIEVIMGPLLRIQEVHELKKKSL